MMPEYHKELLAELEKDLEYYDRIFLITGRHQEYRELFIQFGGSEKRKDGTKKILVLSDENLDGGACYSCRRLSHEDAGQLKKLYFMYEFSDRFQLLSREESFGGILDFADTGILTKEEAFCALFLS